MKTPLSLFFLISWVLLFLCSKPLNRMKKFGLKTVTWYGIVALFVLLGLLPLLGLGKRRREGFEDSKCRGKNCLEGQFCQQGDCVQNFPASNFDFSMNEKYF
jgi:hypothetical protein